MTELSSLFHPVEPWHEEELLLIFSAAIEEIAVSSTYFYVMLCMPCFNTGRGGRNLFYFHLSFVPWGHFGGLTWVGWGHAIVQKHLRKCYYLPKAYLVWSDHISRGKPNSRFGTRKSFSHMSCCFQSAWEIQLMHLLVVEVCWQLFALQKVDFEMTRDVKKMPPALPKLSLFLGLPVVAG